MIKCEFLNSATEVTEKNSKREILNPKHEARNNDQNTNAPMIKTLYFQHLSLGYFVI